MNLGKINKMMPFITVKGYPGVLNDGSTVAWFLSDEPATLTRDGANRVSQWNDYLGSGHDLLQANGADQPLWSANGILFDGVSEFMQCGAFAYVQPEMIYIVLKQVTWINASRVFDGNLLSYCALQQYSTTPDLQLYAGTGFTNANSNLAVNTWGIVRVLFNGASSTIQVNKTTITTGNPGDRDSGGFTLGVGGNIISGFSNIEVKEIILRKVADSESDETVIYNYLKNKYGL